MGQIWDIDTIGFREDTLGNFFDFYVNNTFYLLAPDYYYQFYSLYLNRCLACYDGWVNGWHNKQSGLVPQRMLQSISRGLNNMLFAHNIDFNGDTSDYNFANRWAKKVKFYKTLKKAHLYAIAGGTSLLKINRSEKELYVTAHRIDTFFVDVDATGKITKATVYFDAIHNTTSEQNTDHYGICEERYYDKNGKARVKACVYKSSGNLQTEVQNRPKGVKKNIRWENLPKDIKEYIKTNYPSIIIDEEQYLPFARDLGCRLMRFTDDIPQIPNTPFGQPIGDILWTENFQYDQIKYFEKNEVDLARARALVPEEMWNKDDPNYDSRALSERFYQKVSSINGDSDKVTPIQFNLRGQDIRLQKENIYRDIAFKLQVSASSVASFLNEGSGARTATEIVNERTKTDTWVDNQINLNKPEIDEVLKIIMLYYGHQPVEVVFKAEDQTPQLDMAKVWGDQLSAGNITPRLFVRKVHKNLTEAQQAEEIRELEEQKLLRKQQAQAYLMQSQSIGE